MPAPYLPVCKPYCKHGVSLGCLPARETDAEAVVQLQATAFYESWGNDWADKVFFSVFKVSYVPLQKERYIWNLCTAKAELALGI